MFCKIFKSNIRRDYYIFIPKEKDFEALPEGLRTDFGEPVFVMEIEVTPEKKLARNNAHQILQDIDDQGYHLQMPADDHFLI
jgi:uncharacterized protein YcgL (UPF0745 family)